jgi:hypothetical protein
MGEGERDYGRNEYGEQLVYHGGKISMWYGERRHTICRGKSTEEGYEGGGDVVEPVTTG